MRHASIALGARHRPSVHVLLPEYCLVHALGKGNEAKLRADALAGRRYFSCGLRVQRSLLGLADVREPVRKSVFDLCGEHDLELR